jgi:hypothetical protein
MKRNHVIIWQTIKTISASIFTITILLLFSVSCKKNVNNTHAKVKKSSLKKEKIKKQKCLHINLKSGQATKLGYVLTVSIRPHKAGTNLNQYKIIAELLAGEGTLFGATIKKNNRYLYQSSLEEYVNLGTLTCTPGAEDRLTQGKAIQLQCLYVPKISLPEDQEHRLKVTVQFEEANGGGVLTTSNNIQLLVTKIDKHPNLVLKQLRKKGKDTFLSISLKPSQSGTSLADYSIVAEVQKEAGFLFAPNRKEKNRYIYEQALDAPISVDKLDLSGSQAEKFRQGKKIDIQCIYKPKVMKTKKENVIVVVKLFYRSSAKEPCEMLKMDSIQIEN